MADCQIDNTDNSQSGYRAGVSLRDRVWLRRNALCRDVDWVNKVVLFPQSREAH